MDTRWKHPFTAIVAGPTQSGKTVFVSRFLRNLPLVCNVAFDRVLLYYGEWQDTYRRDFKVAGGVNIEFREGMPQPDDYSHDNGKKKLLIIDDLMHEANGGSVILDLFTKGSHHKNLSVIFITQNLFHRGSNQRDLSLNANYIVLFKNPRDRAQIQHLARQVFPEDSRFLQQSFADATAKPHGYLVLDLKQDTPDEYRFGTCIFPDDPYRYVYVPVQRRAAKHRR